MQVERVANVGKIPFGVVGVAILLASRTTELAELELRVVRELDNSPIGISDLCKLPTEAEVQQRLTPGRIDDLDSTRCGIDERDTFGIGVFLGLDQSSVIVIREVVMRAIDVRDGQQRVAARIGIAAKVDKSGLRVEHVKRKLRY